MWETANHNPLSMAKVRLDIIAAQCHVRPSSSWTPAEWARFPDAADYGDAGSNTLGHLSERVGGLELPTLGELGLGSIIPLEGVAPASDPVVHGRLHPLGPGKESTTGHWELMGVVPSTRCPRIPAAFRPR